MLVSLSTCHPEELDCKGPNSMLTGFCSIRAVAESKYPFLMMAQPCASIIGSKMEDFRTQLEGAAALVSD